ncbi:MAG: sulfatase [Planctomycetota bacterium]
MLPKSITLLILSFVALPLLADDRPNIVFMLSDDQSWNGTSVPMHPDFSFSQSEFIQTPSLRKLASQGMRFSAAYAPAPVCSPTRCSLQLGMNTARTGWTKAAPVPRNTTGLRLIPPQTARRLSPATTTIGELLQKAGYATAHFGKWHLSGGGPANHGYDASDGDIGNEHASKFGDPNPVDIFGMASRAKEFMEKSKKANKPFFIQMSWHALHAPENALQSTLKKYEKIARGRAVKSGAISEDLDTGVGRIMDAIDQLGLAKNTFLIYMSDNGGGGRKNQLRGGKGSLYEGGIRVPLIIRGPGIKPNSWSHETVVGYDFFPTFCDWAKISQKQRPDNLDGGSLTKLLADEGVGKIARRREGILFHFPHYQTSEGPHSAMIVDNMKLIQFYETQKVALFDLSKDIHERNDLTKQRPKEAEQLRLLLEFSLRELGAKLPVANPRFDPSANQQGPSRNRNRNQSQRPGRSRK